METKDILSTSIDIARQTGWLATMRTSQKSIRKVLRTGLERVGVSPEWLRTKQATVILSVVAPIVIAGIVWGMPLKPEMKKRIFGYLKQAVILQLAKVLGDSMSTVVAGIIAVTGELGNLAIEKKDEQPAEEQL
jgi:hypothetical protein